MESRLNYPIKYAVLEVKENGEFIDSYDPLVKGYIVSKCYVLRSTLDYLDNGNISIKHDVVFPYKDITYFKYSAPYGGLGYRNIPLYDNSGEPYPTNTVYDLFNSYEEAKEIANLKNKELLDRILSVEGLTDEAIEIIGEDYSKNLEECNEFEIAILKETEDMELNSLVINNKEDKETISRLLKR